VTSGAKLLSDETPLSNYGSQTIMSLHLLLTTEWVRNSVSALKVSVLPRHNIQQAVAIHKYVKTKYKH